MIHSYAVIATLLLLCAAPLPALAQGFLVPATAHTGGTFTLENQRVSVVIDGGVAAFHVDQQFRNNTGSQLEATFYFPLPEGASLNEFSMWINGTKTKGEVLERDQAVAVYEEIVRSMKDPGVLEYAGRDLIKARIFPIPPHGVQQVEVRFESLVEVEGQLAELRYPLAAPMAMRGTAGDLTVAVEVNSPIPVQTVYSPTHSVDVNHQGGVVLAGFEELGARFDRDFLLYYTLSREPVGVSLMTYRTAGEDGYFMLMAAPGEQRDTPPMPKDIAFVIDTSGSMAGSKITGAKGALEFCLRSLEPADRFNVVRFSTGVEPMSGSPIAANKDNVSMAMNFIDGFEALGGTNIAGALDTALSHQPEPGRPYYIVFLTDGLPTVGLTDVDRLRKQTETHIETVEGAVRFFTFGVGKDVNTRLLDSLAADNRGTAEYLRDDEDLELRISAFYRKVAHPVLADLDLSLGGAGAYDIYPQQLPDLFSGSQLTVMGRYKGKANHRVALTGVSGGEARTFSTTVSFDAKRDDREFIPRMWANRKVGFLLDEIRRNGEQPELVDEVVRLSKRFGIMTPYTSFLVVEDTRVADRTVQEEERRREAELRSQAEWRSVGSDESGRRIVYKPKTEIDFDKMSLDGELSRPQSNFIISPDSTSPSPDDDALTSRYSEDDEDDMDSDRYSSGGFDADLDRRSRSRKRDSAMHGFSKDSGADAVTTSKAIGALKGSDRDEGDGLSRVVRDKVFLYSGGAWVDEEYSPGMKVLSIRYLSDAYFTLMRMRPKYRAYASLGESVTFVVGDDRVIVITPIGGDPDKVQISAFIR